MGNQIFSVVMALVSLALVTLLVNRYQGTAAIIQTAGGTLNGLFQTLTLQSGGVGFTAGGYNGRF